jgi:hypothetical protein
MTTRKVVDLHNRVTIIIPHPSILIPHSSCVRYEDHIFFNLKYLKHVYQA